MRSIFPSKSVKLAVKEVDWLMADCDRLYDSNQDENVQEQYTFQRGPWEVRNVIDDWLFIYVFWLW